MRQGMCLPQAAHAAESHGRRHLQRNSTLACRAPHLKSLATPGNFLNTGLRLGAEPTQPVTRRTFPSGHNPGARPRQPLAAHDNTPLSDNHVQLPGTALPSSQHAPGPTRAPSTGRGLHSSQEPRETPPVKRLAFSQGSCDTAACPGTCDFRPGANKCTLLGRRWHTYSSGQSARIPATVQKRGPPGAQLAGPALTRAQTIFPLPTNSLALHKLK
jgi:hypothetical protein